ncbi:helix-turn-helix domain-containing protein [Streptomyces albus]|uniref:helix-turn-helix domain-containing protein n=1 Tax=Streptomyces sp. NRRL F-5917 TaxID=1463873 RepID=UPI00068F24BD|nr:helix-turn-helix transcriptional regulator [Streptomyces sp. NRRL F-5917]
MPKKAIETDVTGRQVAANVSRMRKARVLSQRQLASRLAAVGRPVSSAGITLIERGKRRVDTDDLVALAFVLGVSPSALLLPLTDAPSEKVEITGAGAVSANEAWDWLDGRCRLGQQCEDPGAAALEFALYSRPPGRRGRLAARGREVRP